MASTGRDVYPILGRISFIWNQSGKDVLTLREDDVEEGGRRTDRVIFDTALLADTSRSLSQYYSDESQSS